MGQDDSQVSGQSRAAGMIRAGSAFEVQGRGFDPNSAAPFIEKSLSEHTRRAYRLALAEFFRHSGMKHPAAVTPSDVINWRDELVRKKRRPRPSPSSSRW